MTTSVGVITTLIIIILILTMICGAQWRAARKLKPHAKQINTPPTKPSHSKKQALQSARNKYLSAISHELRTPLNVIMGYAQLLENQAQQNDPNKEKYTLMRHNCEHLSHLIEGILEFSAIESGRLKVHAEWGDLHEMLNNIILIYQNQATKKGLNFVSHIDHQLPQTVKTDHKRLQQILINLLSNAIKFTAQGGVDFSVNYRNQVATFKVTDTGVGIDAQDLERIFMPFERIEQHQSIPGTGLGLPITQMLADLLGGEIQVSSEASAGTTFTFKVMLPPQTAFTGVNEPQKSALPNNIITSNEIHILVVDDEPAHRVLIKDILQPYPFSVTTAATGEQAQTTLQADVPQLAIIDVGMPGIDGWHLAQWINDQHAGVKIIMLSGSPRDLEKSHQVDYHSYLNKPFHINQLLKHICDALKLDWFKTTHTPTTNQAKINVRLTHSDKTALENMADIGHINGIENYLKDMLTQQKLDEKNFNTLLKPIKNMNLKQFKQLIHNDQH